MASKPKEQAVLQVVMVPTEKVVPYARNPRENTASVDAVAASIQEFGWRQPIVVDENMVILAGHTRYKAAQKLGLTMVPVHVATGLTPQQAKAYRIADNATTTHSSWVPELLELEIEELAPDFDMALFGLDIDALLFAADEQDSLPGPSAGSDDDDEGEPADTYDGSNDEGAVGRLAIAYDTKEQAAWLAEKLGLPGLYQVFYTVKELQEAAAFDDLGHGAQELGLAGPETQEAER